MRSVGLITFTDVQPLYRQPGPTLDLHQRLGGRTFRRKGQDGRPCTKAASRIDDAAGNSRGHVFKKKRKAKLDNCLTPTASKSADADPCVTLLVHSR